MIGVRGDQQQLLKLAVDHAAALQAEEFKYEFPELLVDHVEKPSQN